MIKREMYEPYGFIYITTNLVNGKRYIGQRNFDKHFRWKTYIGSGKTLLKAVKKHGKSNFVRDIVAIAYTSDELNKLEKQWINNYDATCDENFYNIAIGGHDNPLATKSSDELFKIREKISNSLKGNVPWNKGLTMPKEIRNKLREARKKQSVTEETKKKMSESFKKIFRTEQWCNNISNSQKGEKHWNYGNHLSEDHKNKIGEGNRGKIVSQLTRSKLSEANKGRKHTYETKVKLSLANKGKKQSSETISKKIQSQNISVICLNDDNIFPSIKIASEKYNVNPSHITASCKKKRNSAGKHPITGEPLRWAYYDEYILSENNNILNINII